jgi:hypothetical protein
LQFVTGRVSVFFYSPDSMEMKPTIKIDLTAAQQDIIKRATGKPVTTFEVNLDGIEELEDRIAPLSLNRNF